MANVIIKNANNAKKKDYLKNMKTELFISYRETKEIYLQ